MSINDSETLGVSAEEATILFDLPGFGMTREGSTLRYTWSPDACSPEIFEGFLQVMGLQVDEEWFSGGVARGTLVEREEDAFAEEG